jgi:hypothetical protein
MGWETYRRRRRRLHRRWFLCARTYAAAATSRMNRQTFFMIRMASSDNGGESRPRKTATIFVVLRHPKVEMNIPVEASSVLAPLDD